MIEDWDEDGDWDDGRPICEFCGRAMWFVGGAWRCECGEDDEEEDEEMKNTKACPKCRGCREYIDGCCPGEVRSGKISDSKREKGGGIMRIKLKRKTITILAYITSIVAYAMFVWIDWRLAVAMFIFEMSNVFTEKMETRNEKRNRD